MASDRRNLGRVPLTCDYTARILAIDGTWQRGCHIADISKTGAKLTVLGSIPRMAFSEFFLVLSRTGNAHRRCERIWIRGDQIGVRFLSERSSAR
jgi:hypothetical protein